MSDATVATRSVTVMLLLGLLGSGFISTIALAQEQSAASRPMRGGATITGSVIDAETRDPLIGATVELFPVDSAASDIAAGTLVFPATAATGGATTIHGDYFVRGVRPGIWQLRISYIGYQPHARILELTGDSTVLVDAALRPLSGALLPVTGSVQPVTGVRGEASAGRSAVRRAEVPGTAVSRIRVIHMQRPSLPPYSGRS